MDTFTIQGKGLPIIDEWLRHYLITMNRYKDKYPLFFTSQLTTHDGTTCYREHNQEYNRLLRSGITHESHNFVDSHLQMPSKAKEWIIIQGFQGWRFAIIIEKSHNVDTLTVEIWNLCKFDPQSVNFPINTQQSLLPNHMTSMSRGLQSFKENDRETLNIIIEEKSKLDQVEIPCLIEDKYRWIDQWFGSSEIGHKLMNIKDQLSHLQILNFYTDGSLKKHEYNSVQDSNAC
ncbi:hypothetical protein RhiirA5_497958 [Rhizophagus irregularis]|uniref:Uncharacterized protein n=2 Tax=Rhizophagus irregularis TaxID=588596 RepID=A0A2N0PW72_9GLOM|nr:hypothetical protein GLOIN_2v1771601 [Rhizophagus irregularis DAOM 181602=DAOM 197198]PKC11092.1 hypothetical protein RhiirA5_497958 [Rhizophagus irregularis]POG74175.1 hypothetical protein GLOIN_2v1771601 [Rhizophagus irregularis DAOM 181602=DAOM 197198]|eukprot:XP_025181041.1 hypothetical protein GLOIN_2v1771601 [Rhizophagus irregularis DAOM 181602=DAOM 197198]